MVTHTDYAVLAEGIGKSYGGTAALAGFDLAVATGRVHGLLGPNGAGKTTAVRILTTLLHPDSGQARVAGYDVLRQATQVRYRIGLVGQHTAVDEILTGRQNLEMFGRLYHLGAAVARRRAGELLDRFELADAADRAVNKYSGGMRRRLDLATALIMAPEVLFLDEPTTGLDPRGRNEVWEAVRSLVGGGTTVLLTTQYLEEADQLADRISLIASAGGRAGHVIGEGSPDELKATLGGDRLDVVAHDARALPGIAELITRVVGTPADVDTDNRRISVPVTRRVAALTEVARALVAADVDVEDIAVRRPSLDEVFLHLTGESTESDDAKEAASA